MGLRTTLGKTVGKLIGVSRTKDLAGSKEGGAALDTQLNSRYFRLTPAPQPPTPITGGTVLPAPSRSGYRVHEFTSSGSLVVPANAVNPAGTQISEVELLVCAPGGGGGNGGTGDGGAGGGGGGAVYYNTTYPLSPDTTYTVTLPEGGEGSIAQATHGSKGGDAVFGPLTIEGGGGGGSTRDTSALPGGGCSGGAASDLCPNDATTSTGASWPGSGNSPPVGFGQDGGDNGSGSSGAGGGGAGGAANSVDTDGTPNNATPGGAGIPYSISGTAIYYGGGGGGGAFSGNPPFGAGAGYSDPTGGGGPGGEGSPGVNANGVGGGGGGGAMPPGEQPGGDGAKGRVYVAYPDT